MIAIVDYKAGNLRSVESALKKLGVSCCITQDRELISVAERIVFPGVGAAGSAMADLKAMGLDNAIRSVFQAGKPIIGICLGTQIILQKSEENAAECLGLLPGTVKRFPEELSAKGERLKIPHMGWNGIVLRKKHPVLEGIRKEDEFYFVHSYFPSPGNSELVIAETEYGIRFPSIIGYRNLIAVQFHPEKSGAAGLRILENFCRWDGDAE